MKSRADRAKSNTCSPIRHRPHRPSIAGAGSPHLVQNGGSRRTRLAQHAEHAPPHRRSCTGERQTTHATGNSRLRIKSSKTRQGKGKRRNQYTQRSSVNGGGLVISPSSKEGTLRPIKKMSRYLRTGRSGGGQKKPLFDLPATPMLR